MANSVTSRQVVTVGATSVNVLRDTVYNEPILFILTNVSTGGQNINIAFSQDAVVGQGLKLSPGGIYMEAEDSDFKPTSEDIYAIADAAGGSLSVVIRNRIRSVQ
jgi:hypothetical protein